MSRLKDMASDGAGVPKADNDAMAGAHGEPWLSGGGYADLRHRLSESGGGRPKKAPTDPAIERKAAARRTAAAEKEAAREQKAKEKADAREKRAAERKEALARKEAWKEKGRKRAELEARKARPGVSGQGQGVRQEAAPDDGLPALDEAETRRGRRGRALRIIPKTLLLAACLYVVFLIYGAAVTQYAYRDDGRIGPQFMTVEDIREKASFDRVIVPYYACRSLYQEILLLDERMAQGVEDRKVLAGEYGRLLSDADNKGDAEDMHNTLDALLKDTRLARYMQVLQQMNDWIDNNVRGYLQRVQVLYLNGDTTVADEVVQIRAVMYENFRVITQAVSAFAKATNGADATDIDAWSPEAFVQEAVYGKGN